MYVTHPRRRRAWLRPVLASAVVLVVGATGVAGPAGAAHGETARQPTRTTEFEIPPEVEELLRRLGDEALRLDERGAQIPEPPHDRPVVPHNYKVPPGGKVFDIERFIENVLHAMPEDAVGYAVSIGAGGHPVAEWGAGFARTGADLPPLPQFASKPMTVASISKPITTVLVLRLLDKLGISVDESVEPWLPDTWKPGDGVADLRFRDLMTHHSGLLQSLQDVTGGTGGKSTGAYDNIRRAVENLTTETSTGYKYANMNFSIFRLIVPKLLGHDYSALYDDPPVGMQAELFDLMYGAIFQQQLAEMLGPIGVSVACASWDALPTLLYRTPHGSDPGWEVPSYLLGCGGYGFEVSARDLTSFLSHLRYTEQLVPAGIRKQMYEDLLGLKRYGGAHGDYLGHGGVWGSGGRGMHGCVMSFHIHVDASLLVNSPRAGNPRACDVLRTAFDNAWI